MPIPSMYQPMLLPLLYMSLYFGQAASASQCGNFVWHQPAPDPPIAFSMGSSTPFNPPTQAVIPFEITIYNEGAYFDTTANAFRAPVNGVYSFMFSGLSTVNKKISLNLYREKAGAGKIHVARAYDSATTGYNGASGGCIVKLESGEMVSLWLGADYSVGTHALFGNTRDAFGPTTLFSGRLEQKML